MGSGDVLTGIAALASSVLLVVNLWDRRSTRLEALRQELHTQHIKLWNEGICRTSGGRHLRAHNWLSTMETLHYPNLRVCDDCGFYTNKEVGTLVWRIDDSKIVRLYGRAKRQAQRYNRKNQERVRSGRGLSSGRARSSLDRVILKSQAVHEWPTCPCCGSGFVAMARDLDRNGGDAFLYPRCLRSPFYHCSKVTLHDVLRARLGPPPVHAPKHSDSPQWGMLCGLDFYENMLLETDESSVTCEGCKWRKDAASTKR